MDGKIPDKLISWILSRSQLIAEEKIDLNLFKEEVIIILTELLFD